MSRIGPWGDGLSTVFVNVLIELNSYKWMFVLSLNLAMHYDCHTQGRDHNMNTVG